MWLGPAALGKTQSLFVSWRNIPIKLSKSLQQKLNPEPCWLTTLDTKDSAP
jgi:hypothetical protein